MALRLSIVIVLSFIPSIVVSTVVKAEVDKVYHPYVEADTYEFEAGLISLLDSELAADFSIYRFGFGKDVAENLFMEIYLIGAKNSEQSVDIEAFEIEALYQMTEQGEYWADFGLLLEIERERESKEWEGNIGFILEKEFGQWSAALNIQNKYIFESENIHDWKFSQALQLRYRYSSTIEPGIEIYSDKNDFFFGPVILGQFRLEHSKLNWEVGIVQEINHSKDESVLRALIEFEF